MRVVNVGAVNSGVLHQLQNASQVPPNLGRHEPTDPQFRAWARDNGWASVSERGPLPKGLRADYRPRHGLPPGGVARDRWRQLTRGQTE